MQVDSTRMFSSRDHMYATAILVNDGVDPPRECRIRVCVDSGSGMELVIPKRKAEQLCLIVRDKTTAEGYGGRVSNMTVYRPVLVKLPSTATDGSEEVYKQADLTVFASDDAGDDSEEDLSQFAGFRQARSEEGALQLSPLSSPPRGHMPKAILGIRGLAKLRVVVDPEHSRLLPIVTPYVVV